MTKLGEWRELKMAILRIYRVFKKNSQGWVVENSIFTVLAFFSDVQTLNR
jgi:hypothetical protein